MSGPTAVRLEAARFAATGTAGTAIAHGNGSGYTTLAYEQIMQWAGL
ncbi:MULTISPECIES: hypothetical protein [Nonomuraea]|uniref:Uncharacterized protein n=1 Tax=Nonomuraea mangrovi TaxID=2316207 RepID=A0ABW4STV0_9ACTN